MLGRVLVEDSHLRYVPEANMGCVAEAKENFRQRVLEPVGSGSAL